MEYTIILKYFIIILIDNIKKYKKISQTHTFL
jgi:hypothetical protein